MKHHLTKTITETHWDWPIKGHKCESEITYEGSHGIKTGRSIGCTIKHYDNGKVLLYEEWFPNKTKGFDFLRSLYMHFEEED